MPRERRDGLVDFGRLDETGSVQMTVANADGVTRLKLTPEEARRLADMIMETAALLDDEGTVTGAP